MTVLVVLSIRERLLQLLYEINAPSYITPDVVAHFDTIKLNQEGENKVSVTGIKGSPATTSSKVTVNCMGAVSYTHLTLPTKA